MVEFLDGLATITSKELAPIHSVKSGTLQNACFTRPRVVADLWKSARMHIARLMNSQAKGPEKNDDKNAVATLKKHDLHERMGQPVVRSKATRESDHEHIKCSSSHTRQLGCVFQNMEPPKLSSKLRKGSNMQKPIQRVKCTRTNFKSH